MAISQLPPQAYTQETLKEAYSWLQSQPDELKKIATTPDHLVALYCKINRNGGDTHFLGSRSSQNFKSDLKSLAQEIQQFEPSTQFSNGKSSAGQQLKQQQSQTVNYLDSIDMGTRQMLVEVQSQFNLSSEFEALRMLVKLGFDRSKRIFSDSC